MNIVPQAKLQILTPANLLTLARLVCLPPVILLFRTGHVFVAAVLFALAMISDCFDGWLARRSGQETVLGLYLDPVVDKIVLLVLLYELAHARLLVWAVPHLFLARELLQNAVRMLGANRGVLVGANWMGKTKATLQTVFITWALLAPGASAWFPAPVFGALEPARRAGTWLTLLLSWAFFAMFVARNKALFRNAGGIEHT